MADTDGWDLVENFYKSLLSGQEQGATGHGRELRRKEGVTLERWVDFIHYGTLPGIFSLLVPFFLPSFSCSPQAAIHLRFHSEPTAPLLFFSKNRVKAPNLTKTYRRFLYVQDTTMPIPVDYLYSAGVLCGGVDTQDNLSLPTGHPST
ncbi:hypothetical protein EDB89DRAFT_1906830 [Lactarius sanguifluus]|nr:hypothetical protein EDB89DRAFT_1906830 [Lactarius sanguifluus]